MLKGSWQELEGADHQNPGPKVVLLAMGGAKSNNRLLALERPAAVGGRAPPNQVPDSACLLQAG
eukprot:7149601-Alexandrium_andersonii.AAC.1